MPTWSNAIGVGNWFGWSIPSPTASASVSSVWVWNTSAAPDANVDGRFLVLYLVIGTLVWRYLSTVFYWITELISIERWEGTIEYTLMAPIHRLTHMAGQTIFAVILQLFLHGLDPGRHCVDFRSRFEQRQFMGRHLDAALRLSIFRRDQHHGIHPTLALPGTRRPDDPHRHRPAAPGLRGLLPG